MAVRDRPGSLLRNSPVYRKKLAELAQGELSIVHVVPEAEQRRLGEALEQVNEILRRMGLATPAHVSAGPVKERLLEAAAADPLERFRDLTYSVVRDSPCPVLSV